MRAEAPETGRAERIPLNEPTLTGREWEYMRECLDSGWVSAAGPFVERFEREVAATVGIPHAVAVVNGTAGLHIALRVAGVEPGDEVIVSDLTFVAPANAIRYCYAHPVFIDADPSTWQMDVDKLARLLRTECTVEHGACFHRRTGRRIRAVLPVHLLGSACEMEPIVALAREYQLKVVEDAAEAMGVRLRGRHVGTWGDLGVLSFNGNKIITAGGGGMVLTRDAGLAQRARYLTTQAKDDPVEYIHGDIGYNYRLSNLQAALGVAQLEQLERFLDRKRAIERAYTEALKGLEGIGWMAIPEAVEPSHWLFTVLLPEGVTVAERRAVIAALRERGIEARPLWHPLHGLPPYRACQAVEIEHATRLYERAISLPSSVSLREEELQRCVEAVKGCWTRHGVLR